MRTLLTAVLLSGIMLGGNDVAAAGLLGQERITGGMLETADGRLSQYLQLIYPTSLAARAGEIFIADPGVGWVLRYDRGTGRLAKILPAYSDTRLALGADLSLYVLDTRARAIVRYGPDGRPMQKYADSRNLLRPIDFALDERRNRVLVLDGALNHVLAFNPFGRLEQEISLAGAGFPPGVPNGMAFADDLLYISDRLGQRVAVLDSTGRLLYSLGEGHLGEPAALAVDLEGRLFVADQSDQSIRRLMPETVEVLPRADKVKYLRLGDLAADEFDLLASDPPAGLVEVLRYIADEAN